MRILSLSPCSTEILYAIGAEDDIIGVTHLCNYPDAATFKPKIGTWLHDDPERLMAERPDVIVTTTSLPPELQSLESTKQLVHLNPHGLAGVFEIINQLGEISGRTEAGRKVVEDMQRSFEYIRAAAPTHTLSVYCEETQHPLTMAGKWIPEIIELAGGEPVGYVHNKPGLPVDVDALHAANPDLMIFHWPDMDDDNTLESIHQRAGWDSFRAVQSNALVRISHDILSRPGPRLVKGAQKVQAALLRHQHMR